MCTEPKCWRASALVMQEFDASDGVLTTNANTTNTATRIASLQNWYKRYSANQIAPQLWPTSRQNLESGSRVRTILRDEMSRKPPTRVSTCGSALQGGQRRVCAVSASVTVNLI